MGDFTADDYLFTEYDAAAFEDFVPAARQQLLEQGSDGAVTAVADGRECLLRLDACDNLIAALTLENLAEKYEAVCKFPLGVESDPIGLLATCSCC
jgi:hypothetical protein